MKTKIKNNSYLNKLNKKSQSFKTIIVIILAVVVLAIVVISISKFGVIQKLKDWLPTFNSKPAWDTSQYTGEIVLQNPEKIVFSISGSTYYSCSKSGGWQWSWDAVKNDWLPVRNTDYYKFKEINNVDQLFIKDLNGVDCETGVKMLTTRTVSNKEAGWIYNTELTVWINGKSNSFTKNDNIIQIPDRFMGQLNKLTEG